MDVVIPTWNGSGVLAGCLEALAREPAPHRAIVVDNGSEDGTAEMVRTRFPEVTLVELPENLGFGAAVNRGIAAGEADTVVLLNNDAEVLEGFLTAISAPLTGEGVGMVAGVLLIPDSDTIDSAGVQIDRGLAGFAYMTGMPVERLSEPPPGLLGPCGGAAAYRREALESAGGFDERLFAYAEDVDLALRLRSAGWRCAAAPAARAAHVGSATLGLRSARQVAISSRSRGYVLGRWRVGVGWVLTELAIGLLDCLVLRSGAPLAERLRGLRHGRSLPSRHPSPAALAAALGWWASMRHRFAVTRSYEARRAR